VNTLALTTDGSWDLLITDGTLTVATGAQAIAQDVASACRTFLGEVWYAPLTLGVPYLQRILGQRISLQFIKLAEISAGMTTPGVGQINCFLTGPDEQRNVGGQLQIYSTTGSLVAVLNTTNLAGKDPWWVSEVSYEASGATT
jgi:hypothetical protein